MKKIINWILSFFKHETVETPAKKKPATKKVTKTETPKKSTATKKPTKAAAPKKPTEKNKKQ